VENVTFLPNINTKDSYNFAVEVELFAGPIDLLLHLVKQNELPIDKISLGKVAEQYISCLKRFKDLDVEIAGEYLVIATTLLAIKAKTILNDSSLDLDGVENGEQINFDEANAIGLADPQDELLFKVKQAQLFNDFINQLNNSDQLNFDVFPPNVVTEINTNKDALARHASTVLGRALKAMIKRRGKDLATYLVTVDEVSISDRMNLVIETFTKMQSQEDSDDAVLGFSELYELLFGKNSHVGYLISLFLALLELCKRQIVIVEQVVLSPEGEAIDFKIRWILK
jgi:segregation and condensation protein A